MSDVFFDEKKKFHLRAPKGKVIKNSVYSAYTKNKVSSIPSKVEIILLKSPDELKLTKNKNAKLKALQPPKPQKDFAELVKSQSYPKFSSFFKSEKERFDNSIEIRDKYSVGPGEYCGQLLNNNESCLRYQSLFKNTKQNFSIGENPYRVPGPGSYNPKYNDKVRSINFKYQCDRFKNLNKPSHKKEEISLDMQNLLDKIKKNKLKTKKKEVLLSPSFRNPSDVMPEHIKNKKLLEKYISVPNKIFVDKEPPGAGYYNVKSHFDKVEEELKNVLIQDKIFIPKDIREGYNYIKNIEPSQEVDEGSSDFIYKKNNYYYDDPSNAKISGKGISSPFQSKTSKQATYIQENFNPGPAYYQHDVDKRSILGRIIDKKNFGKKNNSGDKGSNHNSFSLS